MFDFLVWCLTNSDFNYKPVLGQDIIQNNLNCWYSAIASASGGFAIRLLNKNPYFSFLFLIQYKKKKTQTIDVHFSALV